VDEVLEHDERSVGVVVDPGDPHDRGLFDRREAPCAREEALLVAGIRIAQELEADDLVRRFVERSPDFRGVVTSVEGRKTVARGDELPFLAAGDRSLRDGAIHSAG